MCPITEPDAIPGPDDSFKRELRGLRLVAMSAGHQLSNIMSGLLGYAGLEPNPAAPSRLALAVNEECDRGVVLCRALMNLAARSYGKTETVSPSMPLGDVLTLTSKHLATRQVVVSADGGPLPACRVDVAALRQAFLELVLYACAVLPGGGTIEVSGESDQAFAHIRFRMVPGGDAPEEADRVPDSLDLTHVQRVMADHEGLFAADGAAPYPRHVSLSFPLPPR